MTTATAPRESRAVPGDPVAEVARLRALSRALVERTQQLQLALDSRVGIEQAKGVLAERYALGVGEAFDLLRSAARRNRLKLRDLAASVVASRETPSPVAAEVRRRSERAGARVRT